MKKEKGTTLIELIIYVAILSIMSVSVTFFVANFFKWSSRSLEIIDVEQQGLFISDLITESIRGSRFINSPDQSQSGNQLSLETFDSADDPTVFDVDAGILRVKEGSSEWINLNNSRVEISDFLVENLSGDDTPGIVRVKFVLSYNKNEEVGYTKEFTVTTSIR